MVTKGESLRSIGSELAAAKVVASQGAFIDATKKNSASKKVHPGTFRLAEHLSAKDALARLLDPKYQVGITYLVLPEGRTANETVAALAQASGIAPAKFEAVLTDPSAYGLPSFAKNPSGHGPEGFLFPATYNFQPNTTAAAMLSAMTKRFDQAAGDAGLLTASRPQNLTSFQVLTVASLVQAEAKRAQDMPKIARVIYNRLEKGMSPVGHHRALRQR
jgi:UPF0755 protein